MVAAGFAAPSGFGTQCSLKNAIAKAAISGERGNTVVRYPCAATAPPPGPAIQAGRPSTISVRVPGRAVRRGRCGVERWLRGDACPQATR